MMISGRDSFDEAARGTLNRNPANDREHCQAHTVLEASAHQEPCRSGNRQCAKGRLPDIVAHIVASAALACRVIG
jgi:hypothetical protein